MANPLENDYEKLTHIHMVVYTWWCWHIYKGDEVGVDVDQLGDETEASKGSKLHRWSDSGTLLEVTGCWGPASGHAQRPVNGDRQRAGVGHRPNAGARSDRTLAMCVLSR